MQNETSVTLDLTKVRESHNAVRHRLLMKALAATGLSQDITEERLAASDRVIDDEKSTGMKRIQLPYGYEIKISYGKIICGSRKIRKLMIDMKIPADERDSIWLAATGNEVLYMAGSRHAEGCRPDSSTEG